MTLNYNLDAHLAELYESYPEGNNKPVIGITTNFSGQDVTIREVFHKQVIDAGGTPLLIRPPPTSKYLPIYSTASTDFCFQAVPM